MRNLEISVRGRWYKPLIGVWHVQGLGFDSQRQHHRKKETRLEVSGKARRRGP